MVALPAKTGYEIFRSGKYTRNMQSNAKTPKEYIEALDEPRRGEITTLDKLIRKLCPQLAPTMQFGMLGYGTYHYTYASGREGDWIIMGLASQKNYISLYVNVAIAQTYRSRLPQADIGKSCVRFKRLSDIDMDVLASLIQEAGQQKQMS